MGTWIEIYFEVILWAARDMSFPLWERGLKSYEYEILGYVPAVVPLVGTWIEITATV